MLLHIAMITPLLICRGKLCSMHRATSLLIRMPKLSEMHGFFSMMLMG
jgi:hypothetical protein